MRQWLDLFENSDPRVELTRQIRNACAPDFAGACEGAVGDLVERLHSIGIEARAVEGRYDCPMDWGDGTQHPFTPHWWVESGDLILDPTREQFNNPALVTPITDPLYQHGGVGIVESQAETARFYHGTSSSLLPVIREQGLTDNPHDRVWDGPKTALGGVYLAITPKWAMSYARHACEKFGGDPVVLTVEARWADLRMDEDEIVMLIENCWQDFETAEEIADMLIGEFGVPATARQTIIQASNLLSKKGRDTAKLAALLRSLTAVFPAEITVEQDNPQYQVHYPGPIGWTGSPLIVS